jgi:hypothetical protein
LAVVVVVLMLDKELKLVAAVVLAVEQVVTLEVTAQLVVLVLLARVLMVEEVIRLVTQQVVVAVVLAV